MKTRRLAAGALSIALAVTMLSTTAFAASVKFTDVPSSHWAHASISEMADKGIMSGIGNNLFAPSQQLSNAEFITMLVRQFYSDKLGTEGSTWYAPFMAGAKSANILTGTNVGSNEGLATSTINRYDMAQLMYNVLKAEGITTSSLSDTSKVADWSSVPSAYRDAVSVCSNMGMLSGVDSKGTFNGTGNMDRAQAAVVMDRLLEVCGVSTPTPTTPTPSGSKQINSIIQLITKDGMEEYPGGFHANPDLVSHGSAGMGIASKGFSKFSFTFKAAGTDTCIEYRVDPETAGYLDPMVLKESVVVKAGETKSFTFDCSKTKYVGLAIYNAEKETPYSFSEGWITNITFS